MTKEGRTMSNSGVGSQAVDLDSATHGNVSYYLVGEVKMTLSEGLDNIKKAPFVVNRRTGGVSLNFDPQKGMKGYFDFNVSAASFYLLAYFIRIIVYPN